MMKYQFYFKLISNSIYFDFIEIQHMQSCYDFSQGVLAEVATCISARWTSVVRETSN